MRIAVPTLAGFSPRRPRVLVPCEILEVDPGKCLPGATEPLVASRVENDCIRCRKELRIVGAYVRSGNANRRPHLAAKCLADRLDVRDRWIGVQLHHIQPGNLGGLADDVSVVGAEHAHAFNAWTRGVENSATDRRIDAARSVSEHHSDVTGADLGGQGGVLRARHAAELNLCEHRRVS